MKKQEAMKTTTPDQNPLVSFKGVELSDDQLKQVKGGDGEDDGTNGIVGEVDIIDL
ncbi:MAG: hypothetical protein R2828_07815 [Saprospiraceae bacterium]